MKKKFLSATTVIVALVSFGQPSKFNSTALQTSKSEAINKTGEKSLFIDVHDLQPGKVSFADVMAAHQKDLATEGKYDVSFLKFWVDEKGGKVYCLSAAKDSQSIVKTHAEAHGLLPSAVFKVTDGKQSDIVNGLPFFLDIHQLGAGNVTAAAVAGAHEKDLVAEKKYGVNFIDYWVDEKSGTVFCLSQAPDSSAIVNTHRDAHGLLPVQVIKVKQGE